MNQTVREIANYAACWAKEAGALQLTYFRQKGLGVHTKSNLYDVVTEADNASENYLVEQIISRFPNHSIIGEESGAHVVDNADYCWVVDLLDGTTNFSQGLPLYCVSIGVQYRGETVVGVIYAPYLDELYSAQKGQGAYLNGHQIHVARKNRYAQAVITTGFPYDKAETRDNNLEEVGRIMPKVRGLRRLGSAAYDLCCVAAGFVDGYWEMNLNVWDICAGALIVEEAGGVVTAYRSDRQIAIAAGNSAIVALLLTDLKRENN